MRSSNQGQDRFGLDADVMCDQVEKKGQENHLEGM